MKKANALCQGASLLHEMTVRAYDSISSLGERLSAPLVAAALAEGRVSSEAIVATRSCRDRQLPRIRRPIDGSDSRALPVSPAYRYCARVWFR